MSKKAFFPILLILIPFFCFSAVPRTISYQGIVIDNQGNPKPDGLKSFTFTLFTDSTTADSVWSEIKDITTKRGLFTTNLGDKVPLTIPFDTQYWLSVTVERITLPGRVRLTATPYALRADTADVAKKLASETTGENASFTGVVNADSINVSKGINTGSGDIMTDSIKARTARLDSNLVVGGNISMGSSNEVSLEKYRTFKIGSNAYLMGKTNAPGSYWLSSNSYFDGTNWVAKKNGGSYLLSADSTDFALVRADSVEAGGTHLFNTYILSSNASKCLGINKTNPAYRLDVGGSARFDTLITSGNAAIASTPINIAPNGNIWNSLRVSKCTFLMGDTGLYCATWLSNNCYWNGYDWLNVKTGYGTILTCCLGTFDFITTDSTLAGANIKSYSSRFTILPNGFIGINKNKPSCHLDIKGNVNIDSNLVVAGNIIATGCIQGSVTCNTSDLRFKINIDTIKNALSTIESLTGVTYNWKTEAFPERNFSKERQIGLIAQDVEKVLPEVVHTDADGYKSMSYDKLTAVLIEAVKSQQKIIESQKSINDNQQNEIEQLKASLQELKAAIGLIK